MKILGIIVIVVGIALILAGRLTSKSLPPNYNETENDGFLDLLKRVGMFLAAVGGIFLLAGIILFVRG